MVQLQSELESIKASGLKPVGLSYDNVEVLKKFGTSAGIQFPLLADPESKVIRKLGIANTSGKKGSKKYNLAYPMTIVINSDRTVAGAIPATVRDRHSSSQLVESWEKMSKSESTESTETASKSPLAFEVKNIDGEAVELEKYKGKVVVMVNVASKCGLTPQYESLQKIYKEHKDDGLVILGFPCNQFGGQEPGDESAIKTFCQENYGVEFDMFSKLNVNGDEAAPLYKYLTAQDTKPTGSGKVKWNFEKFVIGRDGNIAGRFGPRVKPDSDEFKEFLAEQLKSEKE